MSNVVEVVQNEVGEDWGAEQPVWETWAKTAMKRIWGKADFVDKWDVVDIQDKCSIKVCSDAVAVAGLLMGDQLDGCRNVFNNNPSYRLKTPDFIPGDNEFGNGFLVVSHGSNTISRWHGTNWKFANGDIVFQTPVDETKATIWTKSFDRDNLGTLMVPETAVEACAVYIMLMMSRRSQWGLKQSRINNQTIMMYEGRWNAEMCNARSDGSEMTVSRKEELFDLFRFRNRDNFTRPE